MRSVAATLRKVRVPSLVRRQPLLLVIMGGFAAAYSALSIPRHQHFASAGYDLGIFDQAIWLYSRFHWAESTVRGVPNLLGDHFHPILVTLAPLYWFWADVRLLLVAQAVLIVAAMVPIYLFARPRIGRAAYLLALAYGMFWGIHSAVLFDFHEVAFAPVLIASAVYFIDQRRWTAYWVTLGLLLCVKESMALFALFIGVYLLLLGHRKQAAITAGIGAGVYALLTAVVMPAILGRPYGQWYYGRFGSNAFESARTVVKDPGLVVNLLYNPPEKVRTLLYLFVPFLGLVLYSPLIVLVIPLILERMMAEQPAFWGTDYHYSLTIAPILAMGAADGLGNLLRFFRRDVAAPSTAIVAFLVIGAVAFANFKLMQRFPLWTVTHAGWFDDTPGGPVYRAALGHIPGDPSASVAAQDFLIPHLSHRYRIYEIQPGIPMTDFVVLDVAKGSGYPNASHGDMVRVVDARRSRYETVYSEPGGMTVLRRRGYGSGTATAR